MKESVGELGDAIKLCHHSEADIFSFLKICKLNWNFHKINIFNKTDM